MSRWNDSENKIPSTRRISTERFFFFLLFFFNKKQVFFPENGREKSCEEKMKDRSQITSGINFTRSRRQERNGLAVYENFSREIYVYVCVYMCFTADINEELLRFNAAIN